MTIDRRTFLASLGAGALGASALPRAMRGHALVTDKIEKIGIGLYTLRRELEKDFDGTLARVAAIGFREVEFAGYYKRRPEVVRKTLDRLGLSAPSAHVGAVDAVRKDWDRTLAAAKVMGHRYLVVAWIDPAERRTLDDYRKHAETFNWAGEAANRQGIRFAYHNHDFEFAPLEGKLPYDILVDRTDPKLVLLELDLYWITRAGQKPLDYFARHPGRFPLVHVKDMDRERRIVDVGRGTIDFKTIFAQRTKAGIRHFFFEHDEPKPDGLASAKASYDYLTKLSF